MDEQELLLLKGCLVIRPAALYQSRRALERECTRDSAGTLHLLTLLPLTLTLFLVATAPLVIPVSRRHPHSSDTARATADRVITDTPDSQSRDATSSTTARVARDASRVERFPALRQRSVPSSPAIPQGFYPAVPAVLTLVRHLTSQSLGRATRGFSVDLVHSTFLLIFSTSRLSSLIELASADGDLHGGAAVRLLRSDPSLPPRCSTTLAWLLEACLRAGGVLEDAQRSLASSSPHNTFHPVSAPFLSLIGMLSTTSLSALLLVAGASQVAAGGFTIRKRASDDSTTTPTRLLSDPVWTYKGCYDNTAVGQQTVRNLVSAGTGKWTIEGCLAAVEAAEYSVGGIIYGAFFSFCSPFPALLTLPLSRRW